MSALPELRAEIDATDALTEHIRKIISRLVARDVERSAALALAGEHSRQALPQTPVAEEKATA